MKKMKFVFTFMCLLAHMGNYGAAAAPLRLRGAGDEAQATATPGFAGAGAELSDPKRIAFTITTDEGDVDLSMSKLPNYAYSLLYGDSFAPGSPFEYIRCTQKIRIKDLIAPQFPTERLAPNSHTLLSGLEIKLISEGFATYIVDLRPYKELLSTGNLSIKLVGTTAELHNQGKIFKVAKLDDGISMTEQERKQLHKKPALKTEQDFLQAIREKDQSISQRDSRIAELENKLSDAMEKIRKLTQRVNEAEGARAPLHLRGAGDEA